MSRRGVLSIAAGIGAGGALTLAGCGASASDSANAAGGSGVGGTLKWGWDLPTSWDPIKSSAGWDVHALSLVYAGLTQEDARGNAIPALATGWKYNADGTEVVFTLRPGLKFGDGSTLDAAAVAKSLERSRTDPGSLVASQLTTVSSVTAQGTGTVVIKLKQPNFQIPTLLAGKTGMIVSPTAFEANATGLTLKPVGAGPFQLTAYTENASATLVRFPGFWNAKQIHIGTFQLYPLPDASTVVAGLESGQYNVASIPGSEVAAAKAAGLQVQVVDSLVVAVLDVNDAIAPFDDDNVVLALKYAVDRKALLQTAQFGYGEVAYQPFPSGYVGYDESIGTPYAVNTAKAKSLLAASKYGPNPTVTITTTAAAGVPEQLQSQLQAVGFNASIKVIPTAQFTELVYIQHSEQLTVDAFAGRDSAVQAFQVLFGAQGLLNPGRHAYPQLQSELTQVNETSLDSSKYAGLLQQATATAVKQTPNVFLYTEPRILARASGVSALPEDLVVQRFEGVTTT
ncbi:ABC transporter substrate-binding protein [Actinospica sp.]|uniref:ABC transporter substrate-binding protein n=1 Tax=Actinospica sp. TaxID=1872142 RepID=UPI002BB7C761|nr:ABC transporter substrate-binding protein [Actinospica sp.]HWG26509.1 ABC transporter substrate-binding protein [Actinospica sp.]